MPAWADLEGALKRRVSGGRLAHVYRVVETARLLAPLHGVDEEQAAVAALLHDYARMVLGAELLEIAHQHNLLTDPVEETNPSLLHGPVGAHLLAAEGLLTDPEGLAAIRWHTTGRPQMSPLEQVIWLADYTEPGRSFPGVDRVRSLAQTDLPAAMLLGIDQTIRHLLDRRLVLHTSTVHAYNWLIGMGLGPV